MPFWNEKAFIKSYLTFKTHKYYFSSIHNSRVTPNHAILPQGFFWKQDIKSTKLGTWKINPTSISQQPASTTATRSSFCCGGWGWWQKRKRCYFSLGRVFLCFNCSQKKKLKKEHKHIYIKSGNTKKSWDIVVLYLRPLKNTEKKRLTTLKKNRPQKKTQKSRALFCIYIIQTCIFKQ